jgi:hypothetical protein
MKTIADIQREIADIKHEIENTEMKKAAENKLRKRIAYLRTCVLYLETNPSPSFLKEEITKLETKITLRMANFSITDAEAKPKTYLGKIKKAYEKQFDVPKLREQIKTMRFLLK